MASGGCLNMLFFMIYIWERLASRSDFDETDIMMRAGKSKQIDLGKIRG